MGLRIGWEEMRVVRMSERIRTGGKDRTHINSGIEVCEHITLPGAYNLGGSCEYVQPLEIYCEECEESYRFGIKVN
jgi:hypothetical protein